MSAGSERIVFGVDVGGTKVGVGHIVGREIAASVERPTPLTSAEDLIAGLEAAVDELSARTGPPAAMGIGMPSQIDFATGRVLSSVNIPLAGVNLRHELSDHFGVPVVLDNDGNCAALAEAQFVAGGPARHLVMLTLGTGVGGGIVIDGQIYRGATGPGAELGHMVIQADGPECPGNCPNHGCLEAFCSGTALGREAWAFAKQNPDSRLGRKLTKADRCDGVDAVELARDGDPDSIGLLQQLGVWLGVGISNMINIFEPQCVVVGGGLSKAANLFMGSAVREARSRALPALVERVRIDVAKTGPEAGIIGAGLLAAQMLEPDRDTEDEDLIANRGVQ
jgi:glucokinase